MTNTNKNYDLATITNTETAYINFANDKQKQATYKFIISLMQDLREHINNKEVSEVTILVEQLYLKVLNKEEITKEEFEEFNKYIELVTIDEGNAITAAGLATTLVHGFGKQNILDNVISYASSAIELTTNISYKDFGLAQLVKLQEFILAE